MSRLNAVLAGITGGLQGFREAGKRELEEEQVKLQNKQLELQGKELQNKLLESGVKAEEKAKFRMRIREKLASGTPITANDIFEFANVDESVKLFTEILKQQQSKEPAKPPAPSLERSIEREAQRRGILPEEQFEFEQKARIEAAGGIAGAREQARQAEAPLSSAAADDLNKITRAKNAIADIEKNFSKEFLGPRGFSLITKGRRMIPGAISPKESAFQRSLEDLADLVKRERTGASAGGQESEELRRLLPEATTADPFVFLGDLQRFRTQLDKLERVVQSRAITPRKQLGQPRQPRIIDVTK